ncbi:MAG: 30S ribosome-binding factor RbfA [Micrococcales bacterium]|nr:30S ribosome-binding factor RbfA [Micrococcales bacterium]NBR61108.1 30S ribosome-binding factor RbfA [Actinomycetota bacterium]NBR54647.1 30S ribosome-binding factor RbfA [Micrococcales bacterium]NBT46601.1 30S ribosome-binding factor RbfA [Actinomycetota bacterium]NBY43274.1 30S ribosome-binding factor RbfA [Micrococcales bacterium]
MVDAARARRLAERIKVLTASALDKVVKDPDLGFVTITDVRVTPDLASARIFYTVFGDKEQSEKTAGILERFRGRIRGEIGSQLGIRLTPTIEFLTDEVPESAAHMNDLLAQARARDAELAKLAKDAEFAAGENPYKEPKQSAEDE